MKFFFPVELFAIWLSSLEWCLFFFFFFFLSIYMFWPNFTGIYFTQYLAVNWARQRTQFWKLFSLSSFQMRIHFLLALLLLVKFIFWCQSLSYSLKIFLLSLKYWRSLHLLLMFLNVTALCWAMYVCMCICLCVCIPPWYLVDSLI